MYKFGVTAVAVADEQGESAAGGDLAAAARAKWLPTAAAPLSAPQPPRLASAPPSRCPRRQPQRLRPPPRPPGPLGRPRAPGGEVPRPPAAHPAGAAAPRLRAPPARLPLPRPAAVDVPRVNSRRRRVTASVGLASLRRLQEGPIPGPPGGSPPASSGGGSLREARRLRTASWRASKTAAAFSHQ